MTDDLRPRVHKVVASVFGVPAAALGPSSGQDTIEGWDSLTHLHLIAALESEFGVSIDPDRAIEMTTIDAICAALADLAR